MPYINRETRLSLDIRLAPIKVCFDSGLSVGDLNYIITSLLRAYVSVDECYARYNAAIGALEAAKLEFYRRAVAAYEDEKIKENGDIY